MSDEEKRDRDMEQSARPPAHAPLHIWSSKDLMRGAKEVLIEHEGDMYRLRITRYGKLILTK